MQQEKKYPILPADDAVQNWFEENIDKECSASSAIYKFRLWLESLQATQQPGTDVWVKAEIRLPDDDLEVCITHSNRSCKTGGDNKLIKELLETVANDVEWLDESPSKEGNKDREVSIDELWDEHSALIGDDIDDLSYWSGREVMKKEDFIKAVEQYNQQKEGMK